MVNIIGAASKTPTANFMIGGAVNAAVTNFTKALAELGLKDGVAVKAVHPGMTVTGRLESLLDQRAAAAGMSRAAYETQELARAGLRRYSEPEDIANLVAFLASPLAPADPRRRRLHRRRCDQDDPLTNPAAVSAPSFRSVCQSLAS